MTMIYVYAKDKKIKCVGQELAQIWHPHFIRDGYKHTTTMDVERFIEQLHNECDSVEQLKQIEALGGEKL